MQQWDGQFVQETLNVELHDNNEILSLNQLVSLVVRDNPKRAHLLVSKVLGKHVPKNPRIIFAATQILTIMIDEKLQNISHQSNKLLEKFSEVLINSKHLGELELLINDLQTTSKPIVVGYAETATALGAIVAEKFDSYYIHSTRYPQKDIKQYGIFEESHSHATSHNLTPTEEKFLNEDTSLVLVDDELTTGNTIMNTIRMLNSKCKHKRYVVASLVDLRNHNDIQKMKNFATELNIIVDVVALSSGMVNLPNDILQNAQKLISSTEWSTMEKNTFDKTDIFQYINYGITYHPLKNGVNGFMHTKNIAKSIVDILPSMHGESVLFLGLEEDMFEPMLAAKILSNMQGNIFFSSTTRSPILVKNSDDYPIRSVILFEVNTFLEDTPHRFAYNIANKFDNIIIWCSSDKQYVSLFKKNGLIDNLSGKTKKIFMIKHQKLSEPLVGPSFGSYSPDDVQWLLKDLSHEKLEATTAERDKAIQLKGASYAEFLPIEYQPTEEYQTIFKESLNESSEKLAEDVGVVTEHILQLRNNEPVLVSLARAGTPVGILIKRYAQAVYGIHTSHYAVSIVRGRGIDYNALNYLAAKYDPKRIIFVDGWTGKGAISNELNITLEKYGKDTGVWFSNDLAVLADPANSVKIFGTRDDYLIPSACLNSTVSGLISRTVLNDTLIGDNDYHGAKFYSEFMENDYSNIYIDAISAFFPKVQTKAQEKLRFLQLNHSAEPTWEGWKTIERISAEYGINNINLVKPGVGETTRVLLRRVPWKILIRKDQFDNLKHIRLLAEDRGTPIEIIDDLPYSCVGIIKPLHNKDNSAE